MGEIRFVAESPGALADLPVALLEVRLQLRNGLGLTLPLRRQTADDLLVLGRELLELGEQRHVFFAEDLGVGAEPLDGRLEARAGVVEAEQALRQTDALLVRLREDLGRKAEVRF